MVGCRGLWTRLRPQTAIPTRATMRSATPSLTTCGIALRWSSTPTMGPRRSMCLTRRIQSSWRIARFFPLCSKMHRPCRQRCSNTCGIQSCCSKLQAAVYGLYHMTDPQVFYNREDLWTVASEVGMDESGQQKTQPMEPNFVLMKLPGESAVEFVEILPFTPNNRNNLIGWIAGRSDGAQYGTSVVYDFPKTKLVDGPLQIEARIDQNAQLSGQLTLWNQQGSHVRRGTLLVIPCGRALLYAEPIYLQAQRSPMPELRLVVLVLQERLAYGPTFDSAMKRSEERRVGKE